jgi:hypothetical protein
MRAAVGDRELPLVEQRGNRRLLRGCRQLGHQPKRHCKLVELEVGTKESNRAINAGLARNFAHVDARFTKRTLRFGCW